MIPTFNSNFIEDFVKRVKYMFCIQFHTVNSLMFCAMYSMRQKKFPNWFSFVPFTFRSFLKHRSLSVGISFCSVLFSNVPTQASTCRSLLAKGDCLTAKSCL